MVGNLTKKRVGKAITFDLDKCFSRERYLDYDSWENSDQVQKKYIDSLKEKVMKVCEEHLDNYIEEIETEAILKQKWQIDQLIKASGLSLEDLDLEDE